MTHTVLCVERDVRLYSLTRSGAVMRFHIGVDRQSVQAASLIMYSLRFLSVSHCPLLRSKHIYVSPNISIESEAHAGGDQAECLHSLFYLYI